jgi:hypothetical protein
LGKGLFYEEVGEEQRGGTKLRQEQVYQCNNVVIFDFFGHSHCSEAFANFWNIKSLSEIVRKNALRNSNGGISCVLNGSRFLDKPPEGAGVSRQIPLSRTLT